MMNRPGNIGHLGRLGLVAAAVRALFNPASLFANGEQGVWYDPSDLSTLFQDSAGTVPVTGVEQPVGRMLDKSGRGNHAFMGTTIDRPILRQDAGGRYYLAANGANTWMQTNSINFSATDKVMMVTGAMVADLNVTGKMLFELGPNTDGNNGSFYMYAYGNGANFGAKAVLAGDAPYCSAFLTTAPLVRTGTLNFANPTGSQVRQRLNSGAYVSAEPNAGTGNLGNYPLYLFRRAGGALPFKGNFYGLLISGALTNDAQIASTERWLALKTGVTL